jgi:hypothetical protein
MRRVLFASLFALGCSRIVEEPRAASAPTADRSVVETSVEETFEPEAETSPDSAGAPDSTVVDSGGDAGLPSIVATVPAPLHVAVGAGYVFVTSVDFKSGATGVYRAPVGGGTAVRIGLPTWPTYVTTDGTYVYWTDTNAGAGSSPPSGRVARVPILDGPTEVLVKELDRPNSCALFGGNVYFAEGIPAGKVQSVPMMGGAKATIALTTGWAAYVSVNATTVCWAMRGTPAAVQCAPRGGGAIYDLAPESALFVAIDETYAFYSASGAVKRVALKGGGPTTLLEADRRCGEFALDAANVYALCGREIVRVPKGGGASTTLATGTSEPVGLEGITVDGTHVYWTSPSDNTVRRVAK